MTRDWALCRWFAIEGGVIAIPSSPFFSEENKELGANYVRFAFCKADSTLEEASDKIAQLVEKQKGPLSSSGGLRVAQGGLCVAQTD